LYRRDANFLPRCGFAGVTISAVVNSTKEQGTTLKRTLLGLLVVCHAVAAQASGELLMIAPLNQTMPLAQYYNGHLAGGIIKDVSVAIGRRMKRKVTFLSVAGDQVSATLTQGKADGICYVRPFWIDGDYHWSRPVIPDAELVASLPSAPVVRSLLDLRDRPVGTVAGYRYPRVEQVLGLRFQREDSVTMEENLHKMMQGAVQYTVLNQSTLSYQLKINTALKLRADLVFASFTAQCAFSKQRNVNPAEVDKAIAGLLADGSIDTILARYR
jgi:polar amino acid transport system substrate-binding protein